MVTPTVLLKLERADRGGRGELSAVCAVSTKQNVHCRIRAKPAETGIALAQFPAVKPHKECRGSIIC